MRTLFTLLVLLEFAVSDGCAQPASRLVFNAYIGDLKKPKEMDFQVSVLDRRPPTVFLKLGEMVPQTKLKLEAFEHKTRRNNAGIEEDLSGLTLRNIETNETTVLPLGGRGVNARAL
ncbi:MAG: hypothetical protein M3463_17420 [Verrucomicrobiota bacterium]|nr:hypothetical protein [Verrucomicrobiota bacterium]